MHELLEGSFEVEKPSFVDMVEELRRWMKTSDRGRYQGGYIQLGFPESIYRKLMAACEIVDREIERIRKDEHDEILYAALRGDDDPENLGTKGPINCGGVLNKPARKKSITEITADERGEWIERMLREGSTIAQLARQEDITPQALGQCLKRYRKKKASI